MSENEQNDERTEMVNPIANALSRVLDRKAARPHDLYRLAVIVEGIVDSLDDPEALQTIRGELRALVNELSQAMIHDQPK
ncbi:MAG: hypothetical protein HXY41_16910 [Chloroflexi bacterium]|nr:hypothetical protein [Chloroflexota bacterium]